MNMIFGVAIALVTAGIVYGGFRLIEPIIVPYLDDQWKPYVEPAARVLAIVVLLAILLTNIAAYGPRNKVQSTSIPISPEFTEVESGKSWSTTRDRFGEADKRIEEEPIDDDGNNGTRDQSPE